MRGGLLPAVAAVLAVRVASAEQRRVGPVAGAGGVAEVSLRTAGDPAVSVRVGRRLVASGVPARWRPWRLELADVAGDGKVRIVVGITKSTRYRPSPHNCLFVLQARDGRLAPVWLGSALSRPFVDFAYGRSRAGAGATLFALEHAPDGSLGAAAYHWNGFGYTLAYRKGHWSSAQFIRGDPGVAVRGDDRRYLVGR
ncbi:MAG: hypothetical protein NT029_19495 [Armatimonadetes bacterium]|nr:hypothetical protein [Armatimonadota bacterium]